MLLIRPAAAQRVTVLGSTRNRVATSPGVSSRSRASTCSPSVPDRLEHPRAYAVSKLCTRRKGSRQSFRTKVPAFLLLSGSVPCWRLGPLLTNHPHLVPLSYGPTRRQR